MARPHFSKRKPPLPRLDVCFDLKAHPDSVADVKAKQDDLGSLGYGLALDNEGTLCLLLDNESIKNKAIAMKTLSDVFNDVPAVNFVEQSFYFCQFGVALDHANRDDFIKKLEANAEKQGLEIIEVRGRESLLGDKWPDFASTDRAGTIAPPSTEGVTYFFKSPKGFVSYVQIAPSEKEGCYDIKSSVEYGVVPSHPLSALAPQELIIEQISALYIPVMLACTKKQDERIETMVMNQITSEIASGGFDIRLLSDVDSLADEIQQRKTAQFERENQFKDIFLAEEYARIEEKVRANLGSGDIHAESVLMDEISDSFDQVNRMREATRETLIELGIFEVPRDKTRRRHRDGGNDEPGGFQLH